MRKAWMAFLAFTVVGGVANAQTTYISPWQSVLGSTVSLSVSGTSSNVALGGTAGPTVTTARVCNTGSVAAFVVLGPSSVTATTANDFVGPGSCVGFSLGNATTLAAITSSSTTTLQISVGNGGSSSLGGSGNPPVGTAGGDLSGTYPNPAVAKVTTTNVSDNTVYFPIFQAAINSSAAVFTGSTKLGFTPNPGSLGVGTTTLTFSSGSGTTISGAPGVLRLANTGASGQIYELKSENVGVGNTGITLQDITNAVSLMKFTSSVTGPNFPTMSAHSEASQACVDTASTFLVASVPSGTACASSAMRYKNPLDFLESDLATDGLMKLRPVAFTYKKSANLGDKAHVGLYAEDVKRMDPRCVTYMNGKLENYEDRCVIAYLTKVVQRQEREITELKRRR